MSYKVVGSKSRYRQKIFSHESSVKLYVAVADVALVNQTCDRFVLYVAVADVA